MIAVIGGTGNLGKGLVGRFALAGKEVIIGSREAEKAQRVASEVSEEIGNGIKGVGNLEAAKRSSLVILSIPSFAIENILEQIDPGLEPGDTLVSVIAPISRKKKKFEFQEIESNSAAEKVAQTAPDEVNILSAFQVVPAKRLQEFESSIDSDVPVCGNNSEAKEEFMKLVEEIPEARPVDAGPLANSKMIETAAALLVELTRIHGNETSIRFKGI